MLDEVLEAVLLRRDVTSSTSVQGASDENGMYSIHPTTTLGLVEGQRKLSSFEREAPSDAADASHPTRVCSAWGGPE